MERSVSTDLQLVDDIDKPDLDELDAIGHEKESGGTTGHSESVKTQRKRMAPRSKVWTEGHFIPVKDKDGNVIKAAYLRDRCTSWKTNVLGGKFIHMRCIAHIINLVVNDGLKLIEKSVETIRRAVKYAKQSAVVAWREASGEL